MRRTSPPTPVIAVRVRDPETTVRNPDRAFRPLKAEGELVPANTYWLRRLAQADVVQIPDADWKKQEDDRLAAAKQAEAEAKAAAEKAVADKAAADKAAAEAKEAAASPAAASKAADAKASAKASPAPNAT